MNSGLENTEWATPVFTAVEDRLPIETSASTFGQLITG